MSFVKSAKGNSLQFSIPLPEGIYALKVFQDINENGKCDEGWFHIPEEPYGLGNNFRPKFSAPSFEDCKFMVSGVTIQTIRLKKQLQESSRMVPSIFNDIRFVPM